MGDMHYTRPDEMPVSDFEVIPQGWYRARITTSEWKDTKSGDGEYVALTFTLVDEFKDRLVFARLNLKNRNDKAVEIAENHLGQIQCSVDIDTIEDSSELLEKILMIKVKVRPAKGDYPSTNDISAYAPVDDAPPGASSNTVDSAEESSKAAPAPTSKKPWAR